MKTPTVSATTLKKTDKKLALNADTIRRLGADPAQKDSANRYPTLAHCSGTTNICC